MKSTVWRWNICMWEAYSDLERFRTGSEDASRWSWLLSSVLMGDWEEAYACKMCCCVQQSPFNACCWLTHTSASADRVFAWVCGLTLPLCPVRPERSRWKRAVTWGTLVFHHRAPPTAAVQTSGRGTPVSANLVSSTYFPLGSFPFHPLCWFRLAAVVFCTFSSTQVSLAHSSHVEVQDGLSIRPLTCHPVDCIGWGVHDTTWPWFCPKFGG